MLSASYIYMPPIDRSDRSVSDFRAHQEKCLEFVWLEGELAVAVGVRKF